MADWRPGDGLAAVTEVSRGNYESIVGMGAAAPHGPAVQRQVGGLALRKQHGLVNKWTLGQEKGFRASGSSGCGAFSAFRPREYRVMKRAV